MIPGFDDHPAGSVAEASSTGDRVKLLQVLRAKLAEQLDTSLVDCADARQIVPLVRQLADISRELDELGAGVEQNSLDELRAARERRRAG
jgi:hypothetical protein